MKPPSKLSTDNRNHTMYYENFYSPNSSISLPVLTARGPLVLEYLHRTYRVFNEAMQAHSRVFVCCFTLNLPGKVSLPNDVDTNEPIRRFLASVKSKISADRKRKKSPHKDSVRYTIARELSGLRKTHYHVFLFLNGHAYRTIGTLGYEGNNVFWMVVGAWASALGISEEDAVSSVKVGNYRSRMSSYFLTPDDGYAALPDAFRRASYLCKRDTKTFGHGYRGLLTSTR